jgi:3-methyladenine DNA glycosylase AlkD
MNKKSLIQSLNDLADPLRAEKSKRFFKSGKNEYSENDQFIGISMPALREQVKKHKGLPLTTCIELLPSPIHEIRMFALLMMVAEFKRGDQKAKSAIYHAYLDNRQWFNNWDLVDCSCYFIVGPFLEKTSRSILDELAQSESLWDRRIAMVSTYHFIKQNDFVDTFRLAELLLNDQQDLIHKAVGWMLKEVGKRDENQLKDFLEPRFQQMPRTMLRTAIEKLPAVERRFYLAR